MTASLLALALLAAPPGWDTPTAWVSALARQGLEVKQLPQADWQDLPPGAGLAVLRSDQLQSPEALRRFVQAGGRALLAVEGAADDPALAAFELRSGPPPMVAGVGQHPALIELAAPTQGGRPGSLTLVTNHPTAVHGPDRLSPAATFSDGTPFAWRLRLGEGELFVVGDASLFIDLMRPVAGNAAFIDRIGAWLGEGGRPVRVLTGPLTGAGPTAPAPTATARINDALSELAGDGSPPAVWIAIGAALAAAGAALMAWGKFPGDRSPQPRPAPPGDRLRAPRRAGRPGGPGRPRGHT